jgi:hypothetical protein
MHSKRSRRLCESEKNSFAAWNSNFNAKKSVHPKLTKYLERCLGALRAPSAPSEECSRDKNE